MVSRKTLIAVFAAFTIATMAAAQGLPTDPASNAPKPMTLTAMDYIEIEQLVAMYSRALDTCANNGYDYADLYTPDGVFAPTINGKPGPRFEGRDRLAEASGGGKLGCRNVGWIEQGVRHLYPNHVITPTPTGAVGIVDMLMIGVGGDPNKIEYDGYYDDVYVKTPQGWRFKSRTHHAVLSEGRRVK
jgi:hypothetical protein